LANWFLNASLDLNWPLLRPRFNIAPTQLIAGIRRTADGAAEIAQFHWGLIPSWSKDRKGASKLINARGETVAEKPSFRSAFKRRRCLIVADGFYEWKRDGKVKRPFHFTMRDDIPFCFAGLWETWYDDGQPIETATVITTSANELMYEVHDRMPAILHPIQFRDWLDVSPSTAPHTKTTKMFDVEPDVVTPSLLKMLTPFPAGEMKATEVSTLVNSPRNDSEECCFPV
jgi:putative SOS response-associated peptidase YedK